MRSLPVAAAVALCLVPTVASACSSTSTPSAATLVTRSQNAVANASAVHYVDVTVGNGHSQSITGSVSAAAADVILVVNASPQLEVRLAGVTEYLRTTSASVLQSNLGFSTAVAAQWTDKWISVSPSDAPYNSVLQAISITAEVDPFFSSGTATVLPTTSVHGISTTPIESVTKTSTSARASTVFLNTNTLLPVAATVLMKKAATTERQQVAFTEWNVPFSVTTPSGATAFSAIPAS